MCRRDRAMVTESRSSKKSKSSICMIRSVVRDSGGSFDHSLKTRCESLKTFSTTVEKVFSDSQRVFNEWSKLPPESRTTDRIMQMLDFDFFELLDSVTIARSRRHIQAFYDTTEIGPF